MINNLIIGYGALSVIASLAQMKVKNISKLSGMVMLTGGLLMILSIILESNVSVFILIAGILMAHVSSTINGYKIYGVINKKTNLIRLVLSLLLIVYYIRR